MPQWAILNCRKIWHPLSPAWSEVGGGGGGGGGWGGVLKGRGEKEATSSLY